MLKIVRSGIARFIPVIKKLLYKPKTPLNKPNFRTCFKLGEKASHLTLFCLALEFHTSLRCWPRS